MKYFFAVALLLVAGVGYLFSQGNSYELAYDLYQSNDYAKSIELLENDLRNETRASFSLLMNLANAEYMQGNDAVALLNYLRARSLAPRFPGLNEQITLTKARAGTLPRQTAEGNLLDSLFGLANSFTVNELAIGSLILWLMMWAIILRDRLKDGPRNLPYQAIVPLLVLFLAVGMLFSIRLYALWTQPTAVVMQPTIVRSGPSEDYPTLFVIDDASEVVIIGQREAWVQFRAEDGRLGWMQDLAVEQIDVPN